MHTETLLTVGEIARRLGQALHRIEYVIRSRNIQPACWAGQVYSSWMQGVAMETTTEPLLLRAADAARLCRTSVRTWRTWDAGGLVPRSVSIGRAKFWRAAELRAWVASGCLSRRMWDVRGGAEKE